MSEIRIKSGNLYPILIGEDRFYANKGGVVHNVNGELVVEMGTQIESGAYSYVTNESTLLRVHNELDHGSWSVEIKADTNFTLEIGFREDGRRNVSVTDEYQRFTFNNITFVTSKAFTIYNRTGVAHTAYLRNFMLNEGSTALPYQPYFLNKPAHQFTNGEWIDIPTHHYINNRWQGELTSQSPLKFRADGEMLDWRIEGASGGVGDYDETEQKYRIPVRVEGENLYPIAIGEDAWGNNVNATHSNDNGELVVVMSTGNDSGVYSRAGSTINAVHSQLSTGSWSVEIKADSSMNLRLGFQADGVQYIDITNEYQKFTFSNQSFTLSSAFIVYNRTGVAHTVYLRNFEIYFDNTINLYTDHQLMDGDSIDFTTDQTAIPIAAGNNTLTVDTAVRPSKVFIKFEG